MIGCKSIFVEKKEGFNVEGKSLLEDFKTNLRVESLENVRVVNKYILGKVNEEDYKKSLYSVFSEKTVDNLYEEKIPMDNEEIAFAVEYLPGQYDQRADSASECYALLTAGERIEVKTAKVIILKGNLKEEEVQKIKHYYINPVDSREVDVYSKELLSGLEDPADVEIINGFIQKNDEEIASYHKELGLAMSVNDLLMIRDYFKNEERDPSITEIKVIDTYWSDHCRHTTFSTAIENVEIEEGKLNNPLIKSYNAYLKSRDFVYGKETTRDENLMDIAVIVMKEMRKKGLLEDLDVSEEINACSINVNIETDKGNEEYLVMFKNETHNHPTEIEPFGGAATCLGGAIRDPLSGRTYVYQAMRVTGAADPTVEIDETLNGKLPQRTIVLGAAHGYSSYGNQIGLATGQVSEIYHPNYVAKRMEVGAVIAAAPKENVVREEPKASDLVILLGGRTGRDGIGGATGSSKEHTEESINTCGAEVQKGNPPTERKIQRLFRNEKVAKMIKRCNDFGAGGVSVAIGELTRGLDINLDMVPKKYEGLDGTEIAISESQERMAVVVNKEDAKEFISLSAEENLEAIVVAEVTDTERLRMFWRGEKIVDLKREFLDTNGARQTTDVKVELPKEYPLAIGEEVNVKERWMKTLTELNVASQKGLVERFDSTIGSGTVMMPFGGKYALTPAEGMAAKIPVLNGESKDATLMSYGFNPELGMWSPYHMAYYAVIESVTKIAAMGGDYRKIRLTFQEYFERLGNNPSRWGKPFAALLGAYQAQSDLGLPAIGGKDSMSGSFGQLDVPPTLVSFAVAVEKASKIVSNELKKVGSKLVLLMAEKNDYTLNVETFKNNLEALYKLTSNKKVLSASTVRFGGIAETLSKISFGNKIGIKFNGLSKEELFGLNYGSVIVEVATDEDLNKAFEGCSYKVIGETIEKPVIISEEYDFTFNIDDLINVYEKKLSTVFKIKTEKSQESVPEIKVEEKKIILPSSPSIKTAKPRVIIPVFPGTNCEYDCNRAFTKAGAETTELVFKNYSKSALLESIEALEKQIRESQIIMIPGGFSAGDEPDGSGKFIATIFRNERIKDAVNDLLKNRDGLVLGICNGFQALIKLGLVPYGEIVDIEEDMATLTYNNINRHMSSIIRTKITSNKSPWFSEVNVGDIHNVAISHGEGRFIANEELLRQLITNDQIATQYVDLEGNVSLDMPFNPNGSVLGIEGITSPDGRVLGKMGHSERIGEDLYVNVPGNFDQKIFESGVKYFR